MVLRSFYTGISKLLLRLRNRCFVEIKIRCVSFASTFFCRTVHGTGLLALDLAAASRCWHLDCFLSYLDKTVKNQKRKLLPKDTQKRCVGKFKH